MKKMMDRNIKDMFLGKRTRKEASTSSSNPSPNQLIQISSYQSPSIERQREFDLNSLPHVPAKRKRIIDYHPKDQDAVRREYIQRGPCQPYTHDFPTTIIGTVGRHFSCDWFYKYQSWLEYSIENDAAFCFVCYLFKNDTTNAVGGDAFVNGGFRAWKKTERFEKHVGKSMSAHNQDMQKFVVFTNQKQSVTTALCKQSDQAKSEYRLRLITSIKCLRWLLRQGLATRGHDEGEKSLNRGNFLELLAWAADLNEDIGRVVLKNAPKNNQMTAPTIQKDIINACAKETTCLIIEELGDDFFGILADESSDISQKEQISLCLRYVNKKGEVTERFLGIVHVADTTSVTLKEAMDSLLMEYSLSPSRICGQGYDGASNMQGANNGLKTLIMRENASAYYVHCFAHQLQLTLVAVSKKNKDCVWFFETLATLLNLVGGSCKRREMLREKQAQQVAEALEVGELDTGRGLNQEVGLSRPGDTRWGSYYKSLLNVINLFATILDVLDRIGENSVDSSDKVKAEALIFAMESFDFVFMTHLMIAIFGVTHELNLALQMKDQDIVNAMLLVDLAKEQLQKMRNNGWEAFFGKVSTFCVKHSIQIPDLNDVYAPLGRKKRRLEEVTNLHHFRVEVFLSVVDIQLQELDNRFDEVTTELLTCMACLCPLDRFSSFDAAKLLRLATFYPSEFSSVELIGFEYQLENFIADMRRDERFWTLH